jgi:hypothetical protein
MAEVKIDNFVYVLIAAIIVLVVVLAFFSSIPPGGIGLVTSIENFTLGGVGFTGENMIMQAYGSFSVGDVNTDTLKKTPQIQVSSSYFGSQNGNMQINLLDAYVPVSRQAIITYRVHDAAAYGNLIIKWNGLELYNEKASKGVYNLHVPHENIQETNNLEIYCDGPGIFFWASTVYILRDFQVDLDYGSVKLLPFTLSSKDAETFKNGAFEFSSSGTGKLFVKVNGQAVFSGTPGTSESVKFDLFNAGIIPGNNMIALSTQGGTFSLNNVVLKIFVSTDNLVKERTFTLSKQNFDLFLQGYRGRVDFDIQKITKQGSMSIRLNDKELNVPALQTGTNTVLFTDQEAKEGSNTLRFSGTGGWDVGEVRIMMER